MEISKARFLDLAWRLALVTTCAGGSLAACGGGGTGEPPATPKPAASPITVATSPGGNGTDPPPDAPCRCSWDTNAAAAPRVCKKGEENYEGVTCVPGHPSYE